MNYFVNHYIPVRYQQQLNNQQYDIIMIEGHFIS